MLRKSIFSDIKIEYEVPLIKQGVQECVQACAAQMVQFYGSNKTYDEIVKEIPVYINKEGVPLGTSIGHIAHFFQEQKFKTELFTSDIQIFDPSWKNVSNNELIQLLQERKLYMKHSLYGVPEFDVIFDGYITYLKQGGIIHFAVVDPALLLEFLQQGPFMMVVSYTFFNQISKRLYDSKNNTANPDSIKGYPSTHAIVVSGYKDGKFLVVDPDYEYGGKRWIEESFLIASYYSAQTDFDSVVITVKV